MSNVPLYLDFLGAMYERFPRFWKALGNLETRLLKYDTINLQIEKPIFVCGLARSGSTILLEILNGHPDIATHQYRDYPFVHAIYFWDLLRRLVPANPQKVERAHKDRIMVNAQSPEMIDEIIWTSLIEGLHDPEKCCVLNETFSHPAFEKFYREHILKLLFLRGKKRFATKNNDNIARLEFLHKIFPDARFVIPLRRAEDHIASLVKQHRLLRTQQTKDPRGLRYMQRHGHFEFGLDFRPMNLGKPDITRTIINHINDGEDIKAYALYWADVHRHIHQTLQKNAALKNAVTLVRYDEFCADAAHGISGLLRFCALDDAGLTAQWKNEISSPAYYTSNFTDAEKKFIAQSCGEIESVLWDKNFL